MMGNRVFVGGLSFNTSQDSLKQAFSRSGNVTDAKIVLDRETGRSRGFGFVTFASDDQASQAIQDWDGQELEGRRIAVNEAQDRRPNGPNGGMNRTQGDEPRQFESSGSPSVARPRVFSTPNHSSGSGFGNGKSGNRNVYRNQNEGRPVQEDRRERGNRGNRRYDYEE
jgi:RNA recognition motif-containing protein